MLKVMDASAIISHRYAMRPGDDVVIWSLICAIRFDHISSDPAVFLKSKIGSFLNTGYLMSTTPRLKGITGFNWASHTSNMRHTNCFLPRSYPSDGSRREVGEILKNGLEAIFLCYLI